MPKRKTFDLPMQLRGAGDDARLALVIESVDEAARTVDVVWTTGAYVKRYDDMPDGEYGGWIEGLAVSEEAIDLTFLNDGAPVLKSHRAYDLIHQMGVVVAGSARIEDGKGIATLLISEREDVEPHWRDIKAGILRNISVGYNVTEYQVTRSEGKLPVFLATRWMPMELSFVTIPFDNGAHTRSKQEHLSPCDIISNQEKGADMPDKAKEIQGQDLAPKKTETRNAPAATPAATENGGAAPQPPVNEAAIAERAVQAERTRAATIRTLCGQHGVDDTRANELIDKGVSAEDAPARILDILAERSAETLINGQRVDVGFSHDDPRVMRERMAKAIASRHVSISDEPSAIDPDVKAWQKYRGMNLLGMAVELNGLDVRSLMSQPGKASVVRAAFHSTSDFPHLLTEAGNRILMEAYRAHEGTFRIVGHNQNMSDFRSTSLISFGDIPELEELKENGEYKDFTLSEGKETIKLKTYGREFKLTRQMLINDDLGAFVNFQNAMAARAARYENKLFWTAVFESKMSDGKILYHVDHKNKAASGAAPSVTTLDAGFTAMSMQKNSDKESIGIDPTYIVCGSSLILSVERLLDPILRADLSKDVLTKSQARLQALKEPMFDTLSANGWALFADPSMMPSVAYGWLEGQEGPETFVHQGWSEDYVAYRVRDDFAAAPMDAKGTYYNAGA
nr:prohead protease/major capsid protein fusion protein [uncultured Cohaesibacter sp.]